MTSIHEAIDAYLAERSSELSDSSIRNHRSQLGQFADWAHRELDGDVEDIDPIEISRFRRARSEDLNANTMYNQLVVLRLFLRFCHRMSWIREEIPESIVPPSRDGRSRDSSIDPGRVGALLDDLDNYNYASIDHVLLSLLWTCSLRISGLRAIDLNDVHLDERWIDINHRSNRGTPLKNAESSSREINLHPWVADLLRDWIDDRRPDSTDEHGRNPLVASEYGRLARSSIRERIYRLTSCGEQRCSCDSDTLASCPEVVSPHDIRRGSISAWLDDGVDFELLSMRVDSSPSTIERHYDVRSQREKRELRRDAFDM